MANDGDSTTEMYTKSLEQIDRGYLVAAVPIENQTGRRGLFVVQEDVLANRLLKANALSDDITKRASAAIAMILIAHEKAGIRGYQTQL